MHIKKFNNIEFNFPGPDLHQDEIDSLMSFLHEQLEEIDNYPDKSLFFQNPQIIEGWLALVRAIEKIETWEAAEDKTKWEDRTETYVAYLLTLRDYHLKYVHLGRKYYDLLKDLLGCYGGWLEGECINDDSIEALSADNYVEDIDNVENIIQHLTKLNKDSLKARSAIHSVLEDIHDILLAVINRGGQIVINLNPSIEDFTQAIDDDLREWTFSFGNKMFKEMKEDLNRYYKIHRTDPYTPELWGEMLSIDEEALNLAKRRELAKCNAEKQEHWGDDIKAQMDENGQLMQQIFSSCHTEELFDLGKTENVQEFIALLTPDNLPILYDIIIRRTLIQCEMFPELKKQHEDWLNKTKEQSEEDEEIGMSPDRQSKLDEIINVLQKGNWKQPATDDNIKQLLNTVFGRDESLLDDGDKAKCEKIWALIEGGGGDRMVIMPSNLAGFFKEENLLMGSPKEISNDLFCNGKQVNYINKGNSKHCSVAFGEVIPFLKKYIQRIIGQV